MILKVSSNLKDSVIRWLCPLLLFLKLSKPYCLCLSLCFLLSITSVSSQWPPLVSLWYNSVFLVLESPKLGTGLQMQSLKCQIEGNHHRKHWFKIIWEQNIHYIVCLNHFLSRLTPARVLINLKLLWPIWCSSRLMNKWEKADCNGNPSPKVHS